MYDLLWLVKLIRGSSRTGTQVCLTTKNSIVFMRGRGSHKKIVFKPRRPEVYLVNIVALHLPTLALGKPQGCPVQRLWRLASSCPSVI